MTAQAKDHIARLIQRFAARAATEELLILIAETGGMLEASQKFLDKTAASDPITMAWLRKQCKAAKVREAHFLAEMQALLAVFQSGQEDDDLFAELELAPGAAREAIRQGYRRLCRRYHPDASNSSTKNTEAFIRITHAYHTLMQRDGQAQQSQHAAGAPDRLWRRSTTDTSSGKGRTQKRRQFVWIALLSLVLIVTSLVVAREYNSHIVLQRLKNKGLAFVPPGQKVGAKEVESLAHVAAAPPPSDPVPEPSAPQDSARPENLPPKAETTAAQVTALALTPGQAAEPSPQAPSPATETVSLSSVAINSLSLEQRVAPADGGATTAETPTMPQVGPRATAAPASPPADHRHRELAGVERGKNTANPNPVKIAATNAPAPVAPPPQEKQHIPPSPPQVLPAPEPSPRQRIDTFLREYIAAYQTKNLSVFSRFFAVGATENGKSFKEVLPTYADLFAATTSLQFSVVPAHWENNHGRLHVDGRFKVVMRFRDGTQRQGEGSIDFQLTDASSPQVQTLRYSFGQ